MSVKKLHCVALIHWLKRWMACLNIMEIAPNLLVPLDSDLETFRFGASV